MAYSLVWLPEVLLEAGLRVAKVDGWQSRGRAEMGKVLGVMIHHTAGPRSENMPSLNTLINGRSDLSGPLAQLGLGRDGTWYVIAAGKANHAGAGEWKQVATGNTNFIGIECENTGGRDDMPWPIEQVESLRHGVAALLRHSGRSADWCVGHKEYALPRGRKTDPLLDMRELRQSVAALLAGAPIRIPQIPASEPAYPGASQPPRPTIERGAKGEWVTKLQQALGIEPVDGDFGSETEGAVRAFQRKHNLRPDGIVGPKSWQVIGA